MPLNEFHTNGKKEKSDRNSKDKTRLSQQMKPSVAHCTKKKKIPFLNSDVTF